MKSFYSLFKITIPLLTTLFLAQAYGQSSGEVSVENPGGQGDLGAVIGAPGANCPTCLDKMTNIKMTEQTQKAKRIAAKKAEMDTQTQESNK